MQPFNAFRIAYYLVSHFTIHVTFQSISHCLLPRGAFYHTRYLSMHYLVAHFAIHVIFRCILLCLLPGGAFYHTWQLSIHFTMSITSSRILLYLLPFDLFHEACYLEAHFITPVTSFASWFKTILKFGACVEVSLFYKTSIDFYVID